MKVRSKKRSLELSKQNEKLQYFTAKGYDYRIISISLKNDSCQLRNLTLNKLVRMEDKPDGSQGDVKWFKLDEIKQYRL